MVEFQDLFPYRQGIRRIKSEFPGTPQTFVEEFFGILRNTSGTPIIVPWLQGIGPNLEAFLSVF
jgi:hypothetical protein